MNTFDTFWQHYPRRVGKLAARRAWAKAIREDTPEAIIAGLEAQLPSLKATERQFIPHPTTWLNQGRWMDEVENSPAHERAYDTWTDADKAECESTVMKFGREKAVRMFKYTQTQLSQLEAEGYLRPRMVSNG